MESKINGNYITGKPDTMAIKVQDGIILLTISKIIKLKANGSYTSIYAQDKKMILSSKPLKYYITYLDSDTFLRPHKSYYVNTTFIDNYKNKPVPHLIMKCGAIIPIARRRLSFVLQRIVKRE